MNPQQLAMSVLWLAALGLVIIVGTRIAGNLSAKAGV